MTGNFFLDALPADVRSACVGSAAPRDFAAHETIAHKGEPFAYMYFPVRGVLSEIEEGSDGGTAEVTIIGFEGCSGIEALAEAKRHPFMLKTETPVQALAIRVAHMIELRDRSAKLHTLVHAYLAARLRGAGISLGCYARHPVQARLARWLLRMNDRTLKDDVAATHETIASLLGVTRPTVTLALQELVSLGIIEHRRNRLRIVDRKLLERKTCSCYPDGRDLFAELYGASKSISEIS